MEVEPRTAINAQNTPGDSDSVHRIREPGSYYLAGNVKGVAEKHGIEIAASNVSIDLNGFALLGSASALDGITTDGLQNDLTVRNGTISGWGWSGIDLKRGGNGSNSVLVGVLSSGNGGHGISASANTVVRECSASLNKGLGIFVDSYGVVSDCSSCGNYQGIYAWYGCTIINCSAVGNDQIGIYTGNNSLVSHCTAVYNSHDGIVAEVGCTVSQCVSGENNRDGIVVSRGCHVSENTVRNNGLLHNGTGILTFGGGNRIQNNNCVANYIGIQSGFAGNFIVANTCSGNTTNWIIGAGNRCLVVNPAPGGAIYGDSGGASPVSTDPNANYTY